ncbi:phospholipid carrier-dependent glycosyltransferase [soil metagenome]
MPTHTGAGPGSGSARAPGLAPPSDRARSSRRAAAWLVPLLLVVLAGSVRLYRLDQPARIYFDETYYARDARDLLRRGVEQGFVVHPPVGKWLIAAGVAAAGFEPFGWRVAAALAGTLTVLVTYLAGLRLFRRRGAAALAALLLAVDGLAFTMSRIAMLDVFLGLFVVTGFWLLLADRDRAWPGTTAGGDHDAAAPGLSQWRRPRRWLAGVAFGLALATKWSALLAVGAAILLVLGGELARRRAATGRVLPAVAPVLASVVVTLAVVPSVVYVLSYGAWFARFPQTYTGRQLCPDARTCPVPLAGRFRVWFDEQGDIAVFHRDLEADHPYRAPALTWPVLGRPVAYYVESCDDDDTPERECVVAPGDIAEILAIGNPGVWWPALVAYPVLVWLAVGRRDWPAAALLVFLACQYLPWLASPRPVLFFYATPLVPFVCLGLAHAAWQARRWRALRWAPAVVAALAVAGFVFWYPLLAGIEISRAAWNLRIWPASWI